MATPTIVPSAASVESSPSTSQFVSSLSSPSVTSPSQSVSSVSNSRVESKSDESVSHRAESKEADSDVEEFLSLHPMPPKSQPKVEVSAADTTAGARQVKQQYANIPDPSWLHPSKHLEWFEACRLCKVLVKKGGHSAREDHRAVKDQVRNLSQGAYYSDKYGNIRRDTAKTMPADWRSAPVATTSSSSSSSSKQVVKSMPSPPATSASSVASSSSSSASGPVPSRPVRGLAPRDVHNDWVGFIEEIGGFVDRQLDEEWLDLFDQSVDPPPAPPAHAVEFGPLRSFPACDGKIDRAPCEDLPRTLFWPDGSRCEILTESTVVALQKPPGMVIRTLGSWCEFGQEGQPGRQYRNPEGFRATQDGWLPVESVADVVTHQAHYYDNEPDKVVAHNQMVAICDNALRRFMSGSRGQGRDMPAPVADCINHPYWARGVVPCQGAYSMAAYCEREIEANNARARASDLYTVANIRNRLDIRGEPWFEPLYPALVWILNYGPTIWAILTAVVRVSLSLEALRFLEYLTGYYPLLVLEPVFVVNHTVWWLLFQAVHLLHLMWYAPVWIGLFAWLAGKYLPGNWLVQWGPVDLRDGMARLLIVTIVVWVLLSVPVGYANRDVVLICEPSKIEKIFELVFHVMSLLASIGVNFIHAFLFDFDVRTIEKSYDNATGLWVVYTDTVQRALTLDVQIEPYVPPNCRPWYRRKVGVAIIEDQMTGTLQWICQREPGWTDTYPFAMDETWVHVPVLTGAGFWTWPPRLSWSFYDGCQPHVWVRDGNPVPPVVTKKTAYLFPDFVRRVVSRIFSFAGPDEDPSSAVSQLRRLQPQSQPLTWVLSSLFSLFALACLYLGYIAIAQLWGVSLGFMLHTIFWLFGYGTSGPGYGGPHSLYAFVETLPIIPRFWHWVYGQPFRTRREHAAWHQLHAHSMRDHNSLPPLNASSRWDRTSASRRM